MHFTCFQEGEYDNFNSHSPESIPGFLKWSLIHLLVNQRLSNYRVHCIIYLPQAFPPMANVAKEIIHENGFSEVITVIAKSSLDTCVPEGMLGKSLDHF